MWDVQQIEILRGPQSTLQGLNALAGAVIVQTAEPTMDWQVRARAMIAEGDETQFAAAAGGPIVPGELAFRASIEKRDSDGFTFNPTRGKPENPLDSTQIRGKLLWTPSALAGFEARRERFTVRDKAPLLAIRVEVETLVLQESAALAKANLWPTEAQATSIR